MTARARTRVICSRNQWLCCVSCELPLPSRGSRQYRHPVHVLLKNAVQHLENDAAPASALAHVAERHMFSLFVQSLLVESPHS